MIKTCIIYVKTLFFGCLCLQTFATLCSTVDIHKSKVLEFCSGLNGTGTNISLSTLNASTITGNCTCEFTVTTNTVLYINGDCTTKIQYGFREVEAMDKCGSIYQYMETSQVLKFLYIGNNKDNTNIGSICKHLYAEQGVLEGACFEEPFISTTETSSIWTTPEFISTTEYMEDVSTTSHEDVSSTIHREVISSTIHQEDTSSTSSTPRTVPQSTTIAMKTNDRQDNIDLIIVISASAGGIMFTLFVLIVVIICRRIKNSKKGVNDEKETFSDQLGNQSDEYHDKNMHNASNNQRRGSQHTVTKQNDDNTSHIHIHLNMPTSAQAGNKNYKFDQADNSNGSYTYRRGNMHRGSLHTGDMFSNQEEMPSYDIIDLNTKIPASSETDSNRSANQSDVNYNKMVNDGQIKTSKYRRCGSQHNVTKRNKMGDNTSRSYMPTSDEEDNDYNFDRADEISNNNYTYENRNIRRGSQHGEEIFSSQTEVSGSDTGSNSEHEIDQSLSTSLESDEDHEDVRTSTYTLPDTHV